MTYMRHIGIFGSSFNPPHNGHLAVVRDLGARHVFDEIWLTPVYKHPFGKAMPSFANRAEMTALLADATQNAAIKLSLIEKGLHKSPSYAVDTVTVLKEQNPDCEFTLILGSDTRAELKRWHRYAELERLAKFHFIPRGGYEDSPYPTVSSSEIRAKCAHGDDIGALTPPRIANYIRQHKLYGAV